MFFRGAEKKFIQRRIAISKPGNPELVQNAPKSILVYLNHILNNSLTFYYLTENQPELTKSYRILCRNVF